MTQRLFHVAPVQLGPGSILLPGNWGRLLRAAGERHNLWRRELELEAVRKSMFLHKPSRWEATFAFTSEECCRWWMAISRPTEVIYEVEHVNPDAPQHIGDINGVDPLPGSGETFQDAGRRYWTNGATITIQGGPLGPIEEVISLSPLRIIRMVA